MRCEGCLSIGSGVVAVRRRGQSPILAIPRLEHANKSGRLDSRFTTDPPRPNKKGTEAGSSRRLLDISARMEKAHGRAETETVAFKSFDRECDEARVDQRTSAGGEERLEVAEVGKRIAGHDAVERLRRARQVRGRVGGLERVIEAAPARPGDHSGRKVDSSQSVDAWARP